MYAAFGFLISSIIHLHRLSTSTGRILSFLERCGAQTETKDLENVWWDNLETTSSSVRWRGLLSLTRS